MTCDTFKVNHKYIFCHGGITTNDNSSRWLFTDINEHKL